MMKNVKKQTNTTSATNLQLTFKYIFQKWQRDLLIHDFWILTKCQLTTETEHHHRIVQTESLPKNRHCTPFFDFRLFRFIYNPQHDHSSVFISGWPSRLAFDLRGSRKSHLMRFSVLSFAAAVENGCLQWFDGGLHAIWHARKTVFRPGMNVCFWSAGLVDDRSNHRTGATYGSETLRKNQSLG